MRTTLDIDDDVLEAAKEIGRARKRTAGQVISELARRTLRGGGDFEDGENPFQEGVTRNGFPLLKPSGRIVTHEMIQRIQEEIDDEDAAYASAVERKLPDCDH